jgi:hypothetical protein
LDRFGVDAGAALGAPGSATTMDSTGAALRAEAVPAARG